MCFLLFIVPSSSFQTCLLSLISCLCFSGTLYALIVVPPGGFHFNINGIVLCEPYFISNNILALAACLFYFPTTMILMYCYGTIFHSVKVRMRYKKALLTSLPFIRGENAEKIAEKASIIIFFINKKVAARWRFSEILSSKMIAVKRAFFRSYSDVSNKRTLHTGPEWNRFVQKLFGRQNKNFIIQMGHCEFFLS